MCIIYCIEPNQQQQQQQQQLRRRCLFGVPVRYNNILLDSSVVVKAHLLSSCNSRYYEYEYEYIYVSLLVKER